MMKSTHENIYSVVRRIPPGQVATYGQIAAVAGYPNQARLVGYALHALPDDSDVPWFRAINAQGRISLKSPLMAAGIQRALLENEGVQFNLSGKVDLARYRAKLD